MLNRPITKYIMLGLCFVALDMLGWVYRVFLLPRPIAHYPNHASEVQWQIARCAGYPISKISSRQIAIVPRLARRVLAASNPTVPRARVGWYPNYLLG